MNLAVLSNDGFGVSQSYTRALKLDQLAAAQDEPHAEEQLGNIYRLGRAAPVNYAISAKYYMQAAEHGLAQSQAALSYLYENGLGVKRDEVAAYRWYLISQAVKRHPIMADDERCAEDAQLPVLNLADILKNLTPVQKSAAEAQASAWLAAHPGAGPGTPARPGQTYF
jgi:hypothetical protein